MLENESLQTQMMHKMDDNCRSLVKISDSIIRISGSEQGPSCKSGNRKHIHGLYRNKR